MKKIVATLLLSAAAWASMTGVAGALSTAVQTNVVRFIGDDGGSGRTIGCAGDEEWDTAVCVSDPVPTSSAIRIGG